PPPPPSPPFPYTTLFRSSHAARQPCGWARRMTTPSRLLHGRSQCTHVHILYAFHARHEGETMHVVIVGCGRVGSALALNLTGDGDRKSTRLNSSHDQTSY